jgi:hypothetical protein
MRILVLSGLVLTIFSGNLVAAQAPADPKIAEPTEEQLVAAKKAYAEHGATYQAVTEPHTKRAYHVFRMPSKTTDADLKALPDLPFRFGLEFDLGFTAAEVKEIKKLKNLSYLDLRFTKLTDAGLTEIKELKNLMYLDLAHTKVTDAGLKEIKDLKNLSFLDLSHTKVTDAGLKELKNLENLMFLGLANTKVTDAGLKELKNLKKLTFLFIPDTQATNAGVKQLQDALPKCEIRIVQF